MSIRIKRISALFLSLMLTMSSFAGFFTGNEVFAQGNGTGVDRVKTKITRFEIKDRNGDTIPPGTALGYWNKFRLDMDWDASMYGAELKENDYFTIALPKQFIFPKDGPYVNFPLYVPGTNTVIANAHVDSNGVAGGGTVKVTFTKYVEGKDNIRGNLFLEATFAHRNINAGGQNTIVVSIGGVPTQVDINIGSKPTLNDEVFTKWGAKVNGDENQAQWILRINHKKGDFSNVVIRDELFVSSGNLPPGIHYLPESFDLKEVEMDEYGVVKKVIKTYTYNDLKQHLKFSGNNTKFEFEFSKLLGNTQGKQFRMGYKSTYIPQLMLKNKSSFQSKENDYKSDSYWVNSQAGGGGQGDLIQKIKIIKIDEENNETRLPNAEFKITNVADGSKFTLTTNAQGEAVSDKLKPGKYKIKETKAPVGYVLDSTEHEVTVVAGEALFWTGKNKRSKVNIPVTKEWKDGDNQDGKRPDSVKIQLLADDQEVAGKTLTLTKNNNWTDSFKNLDEYKGDEKIKYTIKEVNVGNGYTSVTTGSAENGFKVTNTREPEKTKVEGKKTWEDNNDQDKKRPTKIKVNLLANGQIVQSKEVTPDTDGNWKYEFTDLDKNKDGKPIQYTVKEESVAGYTSTVNGHNITNSYKPEETSVKVTKKWEDANDQDGKRPENIKVQLYGNDKKVGDEVTLNEGNKWTHTWTKLPKNEAGNPINYTVKEVGTVEHYTTSYGKDSQGNPIICNKHTPEKTKVEGEKTWDDANDQDGKRPTEITVNLLANGKKVKEAKVTKDTNWKYSFTDLPKYEGGKEIEYTVNENPVSEYNFSSNGGYNIKNSYTPGKTSVTVTKRWDDANNQDGKRPNSIKVQLYGNDEKVGSEVELNDGNWTHTWNDLPEKKAGKTIKYTVKEVGTLNGYETSYNDANHGNIIIYNKHTPEKTKVEGEKTWDDANDQDGKRPTSITVNLLANGKKVAEKTVTKDDNWKYSFTDLPKYEGGKEIKYTVTENAVPEYNNEVTGYNIKNSYTPKKTSVTVTKRWDDANNQDGKRPDTIKVQLYGDNEKVGGEVELKKATGWTHTWNDLPEKKAGKTIKYTVKEVGTVEGYETSYNDANHGNIIIYNKHTPEKTKVEGKKTWDDADDQDGKRPEEITVNLLKDGAKFKSVRVKPDADGNWKYEFTNLDKYENGKEIKYTVTEDTVKDYNFSSEGYNIKNSYTPKETSVTVTKRWNDSNDKDKLRPESIKVQLYANGEKKGEAVELKADSNWSYTWNNLPEKAKGKDIKYTVKEVDKLKGYTVSVDDKDHGNIIITNTHTPKEITNPKTGDINKLIPYAMMLFASLIVLMGMIVSRRRVAN